MVSRQYLIMLVVLSMHGIAAGRARAEEQAGEVFREVAQRMTEIVEQNSYRPEKEVLYSEIAKLAGPGARKISGYFSDEKFHEEIKSLGVTSDNLTQLDKRWDSPIKMTFFVLGGEGENDQAAIAFRNAASCVDIVLFDFNSDGSSTFAGLEEPRSLTAAQQKLYEAMRERGRSVPRYCLRTNDGESFIIRRNGELYLVSFILRSQAHWVDYPYTFESVQVYRIDGTSLEKIGQITPRWQNVDRVKCPKAICSEDFLQFYGDLRGNLRKTITRKDRPEYPVVQIPSYRKKKAEMLITVARMAKYQEQLTDDVVAYRAAFIFELEKIIYFATETATVKTFVSEDSFETLIWDELTCCSLTLMKLVGSDLKTIGKFGVEWSSYIRSLEYHSPYAEIQPSFTVKHEAFDRHPAMIAGPVQSSSE